MLVEVLRELREHIGYVMAFSVHIDVSSFVLRIILFNRFMSSILKLADNCTHTVVPVRRSSHSFPSPITRFIKHMWLYILWQFQLLKMCNIALWYAIIKQNIVNANTIRPSDTFCFTFHPNLFCRPVFKPLFYLHMKGDER